MDLREARETDVTNLNRINWFRLSRRTACPVYTLQARDDSPSIFMRLDCGTHIEMKNALDSRNAA